MNHTKLLCQMITLATCCSILTGCHMSHNWQEATCTTPKTCLTGGETEGEPLGHTWVEATCSEPKHCSVCKETEGNPLEHTLTEANYQQPATCTVCGKTEGEPLQADFEKEGIVCNAELDTPYPYTVSCYRNKNYTTTGQVAFSDYEVFSSNDTYKGVDGYEWQAVTVTYTFNDENASNYGFSTNIGSCDYYLPDDKYNPEGFGKPYIINYNGIDYPECMQYYEKLQDGWSNHVATTKYRWYFRVPEGYDGCVVSAESDVADNIYFRLK